MTQPTLEIPNCFYRVSAKRLILDDSGRFLLTQENDGRRELPGGGLDHGELATTGLRREIMEETGLNVTRVADHPSYFLTALNQKKTRRIANIIFETQLENCDFSASDECVALDFFDVESAKSLELFPNVTEFLKIFDPARHRDTPKTAR